MYILSLFSYDFPFCKFSMCFPHCTELQDRACHYTSPVGGGFDSAYYPWHQVCGVAYRDIGKLHEAWSRCLFFGGKPWRSVDIGCTSTRRNTEGLTWFTQSVNCDKLKRPLEGAENALIAPVCRVKKLTIFGHESKYKLWTKAPGPHPIHAPNPYLDLLLLPLPLLLPLLWVLPLTPTFSTKDLDSDLLSATMLSLLMFARICEWFCFRLVSDGRFTTGFDCLTSAVWNLNRNFTGKMMTKHD